MKPVTCLTNNDCVRACLASIFELDPETVPHFFDGVRDNEDANRAMQEWLASRGRIAACLGLPGDWSLDIMLDYMQYTYEGHHYMLWCDSGGDHAVIGLDNKIVHNPAWYKVAIDGPHSMGLTLTTL